MENIYFDRVLSNTSCYGLIWKGIYKNITDVAIKMVMLTSGHHYDHKKNKYINLLESSENLPLSDKNLVKIVEVPSCFNQNDEKPFFHSEFIKKRSMSEEKLKKEINAIKNMQLLGLGPVFYEVFIVKSFDIHYAFIVMELLDCSLKDILLKRTLTEVETCLVRDNIDKMHNMGVIHGDLKPSNIGVFLTSNKEILKISFLDTGKMQRRLDLSEQIFEKLRTIDLAIYEKHKQSNRSNGSNGSNGVPSF